jgi:hypothetical protein
MTEQQIRSLFFCCCVLAAVVPLLGSRAGTRNSLASFPGWPHELAGRALTELPLTERERRFAEDFPGRIARFTDGEREVIVRWVTQPTRTLHSAADCFRGIGYAIEPRPLRVDSAQERWGSFTAVRDTERLRVYERIYAAPGASDGNWSDVSSWYWAALFGRTQGPWWAVTVAESETLPNRE